MVDAARVHQNKRNFSTGIEAQSATATDERRSAEYLPNPEDRWCTRDP